MSVQDAATQILQVEQQQIKMEGQIKLYQTALAKLQRNNWQKHFTKQLTSIKGQVGEMEQVYNKAKSQNKTLKQERDAVQKIVDDLTIKLRAEQTKQSSPKQPPEQNKKDVDDEKKEKKEEKKQQHQVPLCGGTMDKEIDDNIRSIAAAIKNDVIARRKKDDKKSEFDEFTPIAAKSQVVAGVNWFLKIRTSKNSFIHIKVWGKLDRSYELTDIQYNKAERSEE
eukprot:73895_1